MSRKRNDGGNNALVTGHLVPARATDGINAADEAGVSLAIDLLGTPSVER